MSRFVLATSGTHGDLNPYVAVGLELKARGHHVVVATCPSYRTRVEPLGLSFFPLRPDLAELMQDPVTAALGNDLRNGTEYILKTLVLPKARETFDDLIRACQGADLLVIHPVLFSAPLAAEKLGIKWVSVLLSPGIFLSAYDPPLLPPLAWFHPLRHLGAWPHRLLYRLIDRITRQWMRPIGELRKEVNLPPSRQNPVRDGMISPFGTLGWFSPLAGRPQIDWPAKTELTGFVYYDAESTLDRALAGFLERGRPPVVFTLGTSAVTVAGDFYRVTLEVVRQLGCRAVLLTGGDPRNQIDREALPDSIFATQYASYSELFPRASAVVHSGGIGSVAQTLRAGVPGLIVPHSADQPDNAARFVRLGSGIVIPRGQYRVDRVVKELRRLLTDPAFSACGRMLAETIRTENGLARTCDALEKHASR